MRVYCKYVLESLITLLSFGIEFTEVSAGLAKILTLLQRSYMDGDDKNCSFTNISWRMKKLLQYSMPKTTTLRLAYNFPTF